MPRLWLLVSQWEWRDKFATAAAKVLKVTHSGLANEAVMVTSSLARVLECHCDACIEERREWWWL